MSCNIRSNAMSPSCSTSSLRVKIVKCPHMYCLVPAPPALEHQRFCFSKLNKVATLHYHLEDITAEELPHHKDALFIQDPTTLLHNLTNLPPTCGEICLQVIVIR
jgi:hypothetical protein